MSDAESNRAFLNAAPATELPVEEARTPVLPRVERINPVSSDDGSSSVSKTSNRPLICRDCGLEGHVWRKCPSRPAGSGPKCARCGKRGHIANQCRGGGRNATKELSVALKDAIDKEGAKDATIKELRAELADKKKEEREKAEQEARAIIHADVDYVDNIVEETLGSEFVDRVYVTPTQALAASTGAAALSFATANIANGSFLEASLWGIPSFLLSAGVALVGEILRPKFVSTNVVRGISAACAGTIWLTAVSKRGVLASAFVSALASFGVGCATYASLRSLPYWTFTATIQEAVAERTETVGPDADFPRDNRPDANNLLELTHRNPGFAIVTFQTRWFGFGMARWRRDAVVSLEKFAQVVSPANQELDEPDSTLWRRVKAACRTIHRVNDDRYEALNGETISFNTAVLCYTALRQAKEDACFYSFYLGFTDMEGPKDQHHA